MAIGIALVLAAACDVPSRVHLGDFSLSALIAAGATAMLFTLLPAEFATRLSAGRSRLPVGFVLFFAWAGVLILFKGVGRDGMQNLCVLAAFVATLYCAAAGSQRHFDIVHTWFVRFAWLLALIYLVTVIVNGTGASTLLGRRSFALEALVLMAAVVPDKREALGIRLLPWVLFALISVSESRLATVAAALLLSVRIAHVRRRRISRVRLALTVAVFAVIGVLAVRNVPAVRERVLAGDRAVIHGIRINSEGRAAFWRTLREEDPQTLWVGHGAGAAAEKVKAAYTGQDQPHNDYLRLLYDYGRIGLGFFLFGWVRVFWHAVVGVRRDRSNRDTHLSAALGIVAISMGMATDNVVIYLFVTAPLALLIAASWRLRLPAKG